MPMYEVTWIIDLDANSPEDAALQALEIQRDPSSTATIFRVMDRESKEEIIIDTKETNDEQE